MGPAAPAMPIDALQYVAPSCLCPGKSANRLRHPAGRVDIREIRLQPWTGGAFLGTPAIELAGLFTPLDAVWRTGSTQALASAGSADGDAERTRLIVRARGARAERVRLTPNVMALARRAGFSSDHCRAMRLLRPRTSGARLAAVRGTEPHSGDGRSRQTHRDPSLQRAGADVRTVSPDRRSGARLCHGIAMARCHAPYIATIDKGQCRFLAPVP